MKGKHDIKLISIINGVFMLKALCVGSSGGAKKLFHEINKNYEIIGYIDRNIDRQGKTLFESPVYSFEDGLKLAFDVIVITYSTGVDSIVEELVLKNIPKHKIITNYIDGPLIAREKFLNNLASMQESIDRNASVAEAGVFEGDFAKLINEYYKERKIHLFDTFEGFAEEDIKKENGMSSSKVGDYSKTTEDKVLSKLKYPKMVEVHKGYFPETAKKVKDKFCFVNLDMDLFEPTYQGLKFFEDKMVSGGVILVHDYYSDNYKGPAIAVSKFLDETDHKYKVYPIGDGISVMVTNF